MRLVKLIAGLCDMDDHIIDAEKADVLESKSRYGIVSRDEIKAEIEEGDIVADIGSVRASSQTIWQK